MDWSILIGASTGMMVGTVLPWREPPQALCAMALGIVGANVMTRAGQLLHWYRPGQARATVFAVLGAMLLLAAHRKLVLER